MTVDAMWFTRAPGLFHLASVDERLRGGWFSTTKYTPFRVNYSLFFRRFPGITHVVNISTVFFFFLLFLSL